MLSLEVGSQFTLPSRFTWKDRLTEHAQLNYEIMCCLLGFTVVVTATTTAIVLLVVVKKQQ